jgi:DNA-binding response OmpR family regulator
VQKTVLVVEDDWFIAMDLQHALESHGWQVLGPVSTAEAALRLLEDGLPSVALLDVQIADGLVTPVAAALRAKNVPFAVASAFDRPAQFAGEALNGAPNVGKPAEQRRLLATLQSLTI